MARPPDLEKRKELARRAAAVLEKHGLTISTEELARRLEINRTTLLYHFPTYADIIQSVLGDLLAEQAIYVERKVREHEHPIDQIYARIRATHSFHEGRERRLLFLSQAVAVTGGPNVADIVRGAADLFEASRNALVAALERGIDEGTVAPCDAKAVISLARAVIDGLTFQRVTSSAPIEPMQRLFYESVLLPLKRSPSQAKTKKGKTK